ncbi:MAG: PIN domain-containing protein [Chthonomonadales bacterium]|nr:PIN domain-containing protein [Chthonomonadales bacterium]
MGMRGFRQWFAILFTLISTAIAFTLSRSISWHGMGEFPSLAELDRTLPGYRQFLVGATTVLGALLGAIIGPKLAAKLVAMGNALDRMSARDKVAVVMGVVIGVLITLPFLVLLARVPGVGLPIGALLGFTFVYLGIRASMGMKDEFLFIARPTDASKGASHQPVEGIKLLDTNVIIDGRIADICKAGFIEGTLYVPGFVLDELQHIADSSDSLKRARGRRGLDILNAMQKELTLLVRTLDDRIGPEAGRNDEVDTRLVMLAKKLNAKIITNDFNLNKVAELQGVTVLNVNELANALKPVVLPGEDMSVTIIREGKEINQGVAYLDDGTMVVVEDGRRSIGENVDVVVTSVLQTVAGKMIFARMKDGNGETEESHESGRYRAGGGQRYKVR